MDLDINILLPAVIVVAIMLLVGLPVHEFSHALAAYRLGDGTAKLFGRLTLNPIAHFDPIGGTLLALTFIGSAATGSAVRLRLGEADAGQPDQPRGRPARRGARGRRRAVSNLVLAVGRRDPAPLHLANPQLYDQLPTRRIRSCSCSSRSTCC